MTLESHHMSSQRHSRLAKIREPRRLRHLWMANVVFVSAVLISGFAALGRTPITQATSEEVDIIHTLRHPARVIVAGFHPDGNLLLSLDVQSVLRTWDLETGELLGELVLSSEDTSIAAFSSDMRWVAASHTNGSIELWDLDNNARAFILEEASDSHPPRIAFSPDSGLLGVGRDEGIAEVWDVESQELIHEITASQFPIPAPAFSYDASMFATGALRQDEIHIWNSASGELEHQFSRNSLSAVWLSFAPDGTHLVSATSNRLILVWNLAAGTLSAVCRGHTGSIYSLSLSPVAPVFASASTDSTVKIWDIETGAGLATLRDHVDTVTRVAFSPDGQLLASSGMDRKVVIWGIP